MYQYKYEKYKAKVSSIIKNKNKSIDLNYNFYGKNIPKKMKVLQKIKKLIICTYNVWANSDISKINKRVPYISDEILKYNPDIICLQNISDKLIDNLKKINILISNYYFIEHQNMCILSKYKPRNINGLHDIIVLEFNNLTILNVFSKKINNINNLIEKYNNVVLTGTLYFDTKQINLNDMWLTLRKNNNGFTIDTTYNKLRWNIYQIREQIRADFILYKGKLEPQTIKLIGTKPVMIINKNDKEFNEYISKKKLDPRFIKYTNDTIQYWPSDHFGLVGTFK
jgi:hypothetical protein